MRAVTVEVGGLDRGVVLRLRPGGARVRWQGRVEVLEHLGRAVRTDRGTPLPGARVEAPDLDPDVIAADQLIDAVTGQVRELERRVLRRIGPPATIAPRRQLER